jgi:adenylylsulfate kinase-like enzyme
VTTEEEKICEGAKEFAREHKKSIARELTDVSLFVPDEFPVSVFMAGSPGAGKTESSRNLIKAITSDAGRVLRIDPDDLRPRFPGYTGANSRLFMAATSIIADKIQDFALSNRQSFVFDGTLSNIARARENISRSLNKKRFVQILYVYQDPFQAWEFVKSREIKDGRNVPRDAFVEQYFTARRNVNILKEEFGDRIKVDVVIKNIDGTDFSYRENIDVIDNHVPEKYTEAYLRMMINESPTL